MAKATKKRITRGRKKRLAVARGIPNERRKDRPKKTNAEGRAIVEGGRLKHAALIEIAKLYPHGLPSPPPFTTAVMRELEAQNKSFTWDTLHRALGRKL
jgi:hypothetical protein